MTHSFNDPFAQNLIGLWDFLNGSENKDTGLADGVAQNGHTHGNANISGGRLHTDGTGDYFDVRGDTDCGNDSAFDIGSGTIAVQFTQVAHVGSSPDVIVNRGEYDDASSEGWFGIKVTADGKVVVQHSPIGPGGAQIDALLETPADFFDPGNNVKVTYSWDENAGAKLTVVNNSTGETFTTSTAMQGLTMDIGDNDDESFTFGAREKDDGSYDEYFHGSIDYVAIYDIDTLNQAQPDGAVDGENTGELMELGYDDSNAPTDQGGDIITNDADLIYGNGGDDTISGEGGDDTIYGDSDSGTVTSRESFNWEGATETEIENGFSQNTGSVTVTYDQIIDTNAHDVSLNTDNLNVDGIDSGGEVIDEDSGLSSVTNGQGNEGGFEWGFSEPVENVQFNINDIDGDAVVSVTAYDANGNKIPVELVGGSKLTMLDTDSVAGADTADSDGGYAPATDADYNVQVTVPGPVSRIVVEHGQDGGAISGVIVTDIYFDVLGGTSAAGDDVIDGDDGDDLIFGQDGDDTISGGVGADTISGGEGSDSVLGGEGDDVITTSRDEPFDPGRIDKSYPGAFDGEGDPGDDPALALDDVDFVDGGAGNDTISTGDDADTILGGAGDDVIDGGIDDDSLDGGADNDRIVGGEGNDTIDGGTGNDTIYAGNDPALGLDIFNIPDDGYNSPLFGADLVPDNGMDVVHGGTGDDVIYGADDADQLYGDEDNDFIDGELDDDFIDGGIGDDTLLGGHGADTILGGDGNDSIDGGRNADSIDGGIGDDTILGGNGADTIDGGDGDDLIDGGTGGDSLTGGAGNDTILGSTGSDVIEGGIGDDLIDGGSGGSDTMSGGADSDTFVNVNQGEVVDGGSAGNDEDTLNLLGSVHSGGSLEITRTGPDSNGNGFDGFVTYYDNVGNVTGTLDFTEIEKFIPCFTPGTLIATVRGEVKVENLEVGDRVITRDNGIQDIRWLGHRPMTGEELEKAPHLKPVLIREGALGMGLPERDMMVSPNHRILIASDKAALYFEEREVLVAAKHLTGLDGVDIVDASSTTYIHVMFDQHEVILSDGAWTESFQPGDMTLGAMGDEQRQEILELFPELATREGIDNYMSARRSLKKHEAQLLTQQ